ncbi:hypothetical protein [Larkinella terrae]|uniref:CHRD domain-containing protein n=1 Tax=Larkinella terrae TaxID=2025311 RepID=A0A7K0EMU7_9BACT|nr:hypothetical protein [Larkinella terrae]MRS63147.1 hypothetical protein [Larkinella terrae]
MKPFFTYLTLSILFLTGSIFVTAQTKYTGTNRQLPPADSIRYFTGRFQPNGSFASVSTFQMQLRITDSFIKGSYRLAHSEIDVELVGAVSNQHELILIESANGKTTGAFKGMLEEDESSLRLSGVWSNASNGKLRPFSVDEVR